MGQKLSLPATVHIVDDDASFLTAVERYLKLAGYDVLTYSTATQLLDRLPDKSRVGCILLDVRIPDMSGPEVQDRLHKLGSTFPIVFVSGQVDIPTAVRAIKAGAADFLTKPVSSKQMICAIEQAMAHHEVVRKRNQHKLRELLTSLTPRERQVFGLVVRGKLNKQISHELGATERTIKAHRQKVMEKMQATSLAQLVSIAERLGVLKHSTENDAQPTV